MEKCTQHKQLVQDSTVCKSKNRLKPYSDQAMQNMLAEEGVQIARRTITNVEKRSESAHLATATNLCQSILGLRHHENGCHAQYS